MIGISSFRTFLKYKKRFEFQSFLKEDLGIFFLSGSTNILSLLDFVVLWFCF